VLHYSVDQAAVSRLTVDVPPGLLVRSVEARRLALPGPLLPQSSDEAAVRLRDWQLEAGSLPPPGGRAGPRPLPLASQRPISGVVAILLVLYPRDGLFDTVRGIRGGRESGSSESRPGSAAVTLPVPQPHGTPVPREGYLAYRLQGLEARPIDNRRVEGIPPG